MKKKISEGGVSIRVYDTSGPSFILKNGMMVNFLRIYEERAKIFLTFSQRRVNFSDL